VLSVILAHRFGLSCRANVGQEWRSTIVQLLSSDVGFGTAKRSFLELQAFQIPRPQGCSCLGRCFSSRLGLGGGQCPDVSILTPRRFLFWTRCLPKRPKGPAPTIRPFGCSADTGAFAGINPSLDMSVHVWSNESLLADVVQILDLATLRSGIGGAGLKHSR
jgi:hypothetical protein